MKLNMLMAALGGALIGAVASRRLPLITVIVNVGNTGSTEIRVDNTTPETQAPETPRSRDAGLTSPPDPLSTA